MTASTTRDARLLLLTRDHVEQLLQPEGVLAAVR